MPITDNKTIYQQQEDGSIVVVSQETIEITTPEEVIAEKEAKLLEMYQELEAMKSANNAE